MIGHSEYGWGSDVIVLMSAAQGHPGPGMLMMTRGSASNKLLSLPPLPRPVPGITDLIW